MHIGLIPLDERPVNTRYPAMLARIAGVVLHLPPAGLLSSFRTPAPCAALSHWLWDEAGTLDALIVSCEMLGYGGLIASRITDEPTSAILARLDLLREIKTRRPTLPILGFNLITRVSDADDALEEPDYWTCYGRRMYRLSHWLDRQLHDASPEGARELETLQAELPTAHVQDWSRRRARNHTVNLAMLQMLAEGGLDLLVLSSDDTSPYGLPSREKRWLAEWAQRLESGERLLMYPGADEVGCALLARLINQWAGISPRFEPYYAVPGGDQVVAAFEDGPVRVTVERQVRAVGGAINPGECEVFLAINSPVERRSEWHPDHAERERQERWPHLEALVDQIARRQAQGQAVVVADVAYPNGADPALIDLLRERVNLTGLAAYGAWNTAGNTLGAALAQGCVARLIRTDEQRAAQEKFLLHRFIEDWGYQHLVRAHIRDWLQAATAQREPSAANLDETRHEIEARLQALMAQLPGFAGRFRIVPGSVRLPWQRTFELDFHLECAIDG